MKIVDIKNHEFWDLNLICNEYVQEFKRSKIVKKLLKGRVYDEVYQLAADMGGAGYIFTGDNDTNVMHNSRSLT